MPDTFNADTFNARLVWSIPPQLAWRPDQIPGHKDGMVSLRALALVLLVVPAPSTPASNGARDFDFEVGSWRVHHRTLKKLPDGGTEWVEFEGTSTNHQIMDGLANIEENVFHTANGTRRGVALRSF
ncbi:MAG TPA: hypothetical protein VGG91_15000, partial [Myxococcaceae bacterium]